ncbi:condensin subunit ScpB [Syntrophobotulus glycolicus DSM 8271]|uniref:Segregation and condensation protein B n=1 Tax=Syntrophobotulus glycolicus (strain DSM 8271 / FlGlyR) TaxID=645991 RepID=F0T063_SYNGF|nr:SMC-Scp complex subunit ScpB [Syntrophobotulus glycolicus]ADY56150.1 condensin subunit ScpB [Syntrophobotulus glycolicus DSM 8271]
MLFQEPETAAIEALLFVAKEPLTIEKLSEILEISSETVLEIIELLRSRYEDTACGLTIIQVEQGYKMGTKSPYSKYIEVLYKQPSQGLSNAALEVLSIVAYKQPVTRGEIDFIRGVQSDRALATLVEKELVQDVGRKDSPGRPILYGTTGKFLIHFGLNSIQDLPEIESLYQEQDGEEETDIQDDIF